MSERTLKVRLRLYNIFGRKGLVTTSRVRYYSSDTQQAIVEDCLSGSFTELEVLKI